MLKWLASPRRQFKRIDGLVRRCSSQEGNAVYACSRLGFARDPRVRQLVDWLLEWQWPDGGWNCDLKATGRRSCRRSSFHETVTPALGLAAYHAATQDTGALTAARRAAELFLEHRLFRSRRPDGRFCGPAWHSAERPDAVDWGSGPDNEMLNLRAEMVLRAAGRS